MSNRITFKFSQNDTDWKALKKRLKPLTKDPRAKVGIVGQKADDEKGGANMAEIAAVHEFGSPKRGIPERSFIRSTLEANKDQYVALLKPLLVQLLDGRLVVKRLLGLWGIKAASDVRARLLRGSPIPPPLSPKTIELRKKRAVERAKTQNDKKLRSSDGRFLSLKGVGMRPLVETGQLVAAISYDVQMEGVERPGT